jgi:transposase
MDRESLRLLLAQGVSLAEIGRRFDRHESTVAYWVQKHGLQAVNREKHAARGGLTRDELEPLVTAGMSIAQISAATGRSKATIRHWLRRYALETRGAAGRRRSSEAKRALDAGVDAPTLHCRHHGETPFVLDKRGIFRCKRCRSEAVSRRRRRAKLMLVQEAGGACRACGYDREVRALQFHHLDPALKRLEINARGAGTAIAKLRAEARKCILLCANCHAEVEAGLITLPASHGPP